MPAQPQPQNGLQLLAADRREVENMFARFEKTGGAAAKEKIVRQICTALKIHAMIEEEIYYPAIEGRVEEPDLEEAYVEHDSAKLLINELEAAEPDEAYYDAKVKVLSRAHRASCEGGGEAARQPLPADPHQRP